MPEITAIIFDWGGVLIEDPAPGLMRYCADAFGVPFEDYISAHRQLQNDFQKGLMPEERFWEEISRRLDRPEPAVPSLWGDAFRAAYKPRAEMFDLAAALRSKGYRTGFLSNTEVPAMQFFHTLDYDMFDALVFSCAEATHKPEPRVYAIALERLGVEPAQAVFIDDLPEYIEGARQMGLSTILFRSAAETKRRLIELGVEPD